jgi:hypothetical protein
VGSPTSAARLYYVERRRRADGQGEFPVMLDDGRGHRSLLLIMDRSAAVAWSPGGKRFFIDNYEGSNITDCYVVRPTGTGVKGVSLISITNRAPGHPTGLERPIVSHYYVTCGRWISDTQLSGAIRGHTDESGGGHEFNYPFLYDAARNRIAWRRQ